MNKKEVASYINYTNLSSTVTKEEVAKMCEDANKFGFHSVCVNPRYVEFAKESLNDLGSKVKVSTVVGFPLGENTQEIKAMEAVMAKESGADELEMVISISSTMIANYEYVHEELKRVVDCTDIPVKAIIETSKLTDEQIVKVCEVCIDAGVSFVKTSTGFETRGATPEEVKLISDNVAGVCEVEASGYIENLEQMYDLICAGATRIGTSFAIKILEEFDKNKSNK